MTNYSEKHPVPLGIAQDLRTLWMLLIIVNGILVDNKTVTIKEIYDGRELSISSK